MAHQLRYYQQGALDAVADYWNDGGGNPLVEMATGTGKSVVIAGLNKRLLTDFDGFRVLMLTHVRELVQQNAKALLREWNQAPIGINSAGLGRRDRHSQILFASIQSVYKSGASLGPRDLVMVDECDLIPREGQGMYRRLLDDLRNTVPDLRVAGFTATAYRLDSGRIDEGEDRLFDDTVYEYGLARGVDDGYLAPLIAKQTATEIDVTNIARKGGEFVNDDIEREAEKIVESACEEIVKFGRDESRRGWLVFCAGINSAMQVRDVLQRMGVNCETISSKTDKSERDRIINAFRAGQIECLTNANVLTTGFDVPHVDLLASLRPTLSTRLYVQKLGRGTRVVWPHGFDPESCDAAERIKVIAGSTKPNCRVLDFAGNVRRHGPVDAVTVTSKKKGDGDRPEKTNPDTVRAKICPNCQYYNALSTLECIHCGYQWPKVGPKHSAVADVAPVMTREIVNKWIPVSDVRADIHRKSGGDGPDSLRIEYLCGFEVYKEWICVEHSGWAGAKAEAWWRAMGGKMPAPKTVSDAMSRATELATAGNVEAITVTREGKFWKVNGWRAKRDGVMFEINDKYQSKMVGRA